MPHPPLLHSARISVAVAGFEDIMSRGLRTLIDEDDHLELVAAGLRSDNLADVLADLSPDVCLLNFNSLRTAADVHRLHAAHPDIRFVVLANRPSPVECNQLLAFGATACLGKEVQERDILNAIHLASRGLHVLPRASRAFNESGPELLTPREADVLEQLRDGRSNAEIAVALCVSVETVRTHRRNIYRKLGVRTRRELATLGR
jgi:DNA-binding NarL/FixJ family response regulator